MLRLPTGAQNVLHCEAKGINEQTSAADETTYFNKLKMGVIHLKTKQNTSGEQNWKYIS